MLYFSLLETEDDRKLFQHIYEENYLRMYHVAFKLLKQPFDAEDAVCEAFLTLAERFQKYHHLNEGEMTGFCVVIVKNKVIDHIRRKNRYSDTELEELVLFEEETFRNPEFALEQKEEQKKVLRAMCLVSEVYRETLLLKYYYELSNREIAKIQGVSLKTVEMRLYRGKKKLKMVMYKDKEMCH